MRRGHRQAHRLSAYALAAAVAAILLAAFSLRADFADAPAPERLSAGEPR